MLVEHPAVLLPDVPYLCKLLPLKHVPDINYLGVCFDFLKLH